MGMAVDLFDMAFCVLDNPRLLYEIMAMIPPPLFGLLVSSLRARVCDVCSDVSRCLRETLIWKSVH